MTECLNYFAALSLTETSEVVLRIAFKFVPLLTAAAEQVAIIPTWIA